MIRAGFARLDSRGPSSSRGLECHDPLHRIHRSVCGVTGKADPAGGIPAEIGPYRLEGLLGEGGMGRVYLGRTPAGSAVAVTVVHRAYAADPEFRKRFALEVAAARRVQGLYTVPVVAADLDTGEPWLATAYAPGPSLQQAVGERGPPPADEVLALTARVAESLETIHAAGGLRERPLTGGQGGREFRDPLQSRSAETRLATVTVLKTKAMIAFAEMVRRMSREVTLTSVVPKVVMTATAK